MLGTLQVFNLRTALLTLMFGCGFLFPLSSSHFIVPVHLGGLDGASRTTLDATPLIRCISPMSSVFFFARRCLGKVPGGAPFSQLHKGIGSIARTGQLMHFYKSKQIQTKQRHQQIPNCGGREDETDARAVRPNSLARCIE